MKERTSKEKHVAALLNNNQFDDALKQIKGWNDVQIAEFHRTYPQLHLQLSSEEFHDFWEQWRLKLRLPNYPDFRFMAQPGVNDADFVTGYLLYLLELKPEAGKKDEADKETGFRSTDYLSFHLVRKRLHSCYVSLGKAKEEDLLKIGRILYNLEVFAKLHGCPGYLLIANGYMQLAVAYLRLQQTDACSHAFQLCWQYLHLASLSEKDSQESIHNAYFGKGLVLSNPFNLKTVLEMKHYCLKAAADLLPLESQTRAEMDAYSMYHHVKNLRELAEDVRPGLRM